MNKEKITGNKVQKREYTSTYWKEIGSDFAIISKPNLVLLAKYIQEMKGDRSLDKYAYDCGIPANTLYRTVRGDRVRSLAYKDIMLLFEHSVKCHVTLEKLIAANGMILSPLVLDIRKEMDKTVQSESENCCNTGKDTLSPAEAFSEVPWEPSPADDKHESVHKDSEKREEDDIRFIVHEVDTSEQDEYEEFIKNLAFFAGKRSKNQMICLHQKKAELYNNSAIIELLRRYSELAAEEEKTERDLFMNYFKEGEEVKHIDHKSNDYKAVLEKLIF